MIPYGRQDISEEDIDGVVEVLRSDWLTQGPAVPRFEQLVANYCGANDAVAVNSATSALHLACLALGLGPGDWLWTSPNTFVASANCALYCGAQVDFVDIDPQTYNMSVEALAEKLRLAETTRSLPKVVVPVHFAGQPCDMPAIHALGKRYGFRIIEDASHAIGGSYFATDYADFRQPTPSQSPEIQPIKIGSCTHSDITVFSFHPVKIVTTGEGGMALTNDKELSRRIRLLRSHGITREPELMTHASDGPWYYQQIELGFNYRMTEFQAELGRSQMKRLDHYVARRHALAARYDGLLSNLPVILPWRHPKSYSSFHLYVIRLKLAQIGKTQCQVFEALRELGIGVNLHYIPVHTQPFYQRMGFKAGNFPEAERYYTEAMSLPIFPAMTGEQQDRVIAALHSVLTP